MRRFIKKNKMKFRKRKFGKEQTSEECIGDFEVFFNKVRFYFLQPTDDDGAGGRDPLRDRFPLD